MKRILSAALASAMLLGAVSPALAGDIARTKAAAKQPLDMKAHGMMHMHAAPMAKQFAGVPGKKHFGTAPMKKSQLTSHGMMASNIPNLKGKKKTFKP
ncbi:MAG TPA: hypothetical protein VFL13_02745 [Candidatus Baltobacteraceae bacterium]|nr:hypothetical protein [Candidatus Baltobacteraceae bacterium]